MALDDVLELVGQGHEHHVDIDFAENRAAGVATVGGIRTLVIWYT